MARKRKHPLPVQPPPPPALKDFDSDSPLGSPDSCCGSSSPSSASGGAGGGGAGKTDKPPMVRSAANARERSRMRVLSKAFSRLKTTLPWVPADTKLSKLDTLRLASCYIAHLREILADDSNNAPGGTAVTGKAGGGGKTSSGGGKGSVGAGPNAPIHPLSLTWPFTFNGRVTMSPSSFAVDVVASSRQKDALLSTSTSSSNQTSSCVSNKTPIAS